MSLQVWLPLNGDIKNYGASDISTSLLSGTSYTDNGKIGKALFNSGDGQGVNLPSAMTTLSSYSNYSMCAWVYMTSTATNHSSTILSSGDWNASASQCCFGFYNYSSGYGTLLCPNKSGWWNGISLPSKIQLVTWYHVCITYDGTTTKGYINGEYVGSYSGGGITSTSETNNAYVGSATYYTGFTLKGYINDFRIYDHCLSVAEVKEISQALVLHYPLRDPSKKENLFSSTSSVGNLVSSTNIARTTDKGVTYTSTANSFSIRISDLGFNGAGTYSISFYAKATKAGTLNIDICDVGTGVTVNLGTTPTFYSGTATVSNYCTPGNYNGFCDFNTNISGGGTVYISYIKVERGNEITPWCPAIVDNPSRTDLIEYDCSGYNRNGTTTASTNPIAVNGSPRNVLCYQFDGSDDYIISSVKQSEILADKKFTISAWVYPTVHSPNKGVFGPHEYTNGQPLGIYFCQAENTGFAFGLATGSGWGNAIIDTNYTLNVWTYYTLTYNGNNIIVYKNGTKLGETTGTFAPATANYIWVGRTYPDSVRYWKGKISDVRVYATALSADDVLRLYKTSASIDKNKALHCYELENDSENVFTSENVQEYATSFTGAYGQWTTRNSVPAMTIEPNRFYHADSRDQEVLKDYFVPNTSYKFDMWIDSDDVVYNNNNVPGGFIIYYTDGSNDSTFVVDGNHSSPKGFQHKTLITPSSKSIKGIGIYYYTSIPVFYRAGSSIVPISSTSIKKNGTFKDGYTVEFDDTISINKGGTSYADSIIEF